MRAWRLKVANYKSLGETRNELSIARGITVVIGKNESGKTNLIEAAGEIDFFRIPYKIDSADKKLNRLAGGDEIAISLTLKDDENKDAYTQIVVRACNCFGKKNYPSDKTPHNYDQRTCLSDEGCNNDLHELCIEPRGYNKPNKKGCSCGVSVSGWLVESARKDKEINTCLKQLNSLSDADKNFAVVFWDYFCTNPYRLLDCLQQKEKEASSNISKAAQQSTESYVEYDSTSSKKHANGLQNLYKRLYNSTASHVWKLPYIFFVNNDSKNVFREYYHLDEISNLGDEDIFAKLLNVANISVSHLADESERKNPLAKELIRAGLESVAASFSLLYKKNLSLDCEIHDGRLHLTTARNGKKLMFDELPISEKWFFALFVDILWRKIKNKNILFVFDQPGLFMHVNAQKELLKIFGRITSAGHQIIYTTHSPYLLDINDIASIRAVEKQGGITHIYNKIYAGELSKGAKIETLTPIFEALGVGFSPDHALKETRINLIVEGISDYYYIKAMLYYIFQAQQGLSVNTDSLPYVLPSVGASNIANVASILIGWGQPFKAIVDYDDEGKKAAEKLCEKLGLVAGEDVFFINGKKSYQGDSFCRVEDMLDRTDRLKIQTLLGKRTKALVSREFYDQVLSGKLIPSPATIENFKKLFAALRLNILN